MHSEKKGIDPAFTLACIGLSLIAGLLARLPYFFHFDFPLNDGALFHEMIAAILADGFRLPELVRYNGLEIPFAYPPFSFYLAALVETLSGASLRAVVTWMPLVFSVACIPLFVLLAARLTDRRSTLLFAALVFPLIPRSYEWMIMGGGVSRSLGFFLALVALLLCMRIRSLDDRRGIALCLVALALTLVTHLEWGITAYVSVALFTLQRWPNRRALATLFVVGCGMGVLTLPWWGTVLARHGLDPFLAASGAGEWEKDRLVNRILRFNLFTLPETWFTVAGYVGMAFALARRRWLPVAWLLLILASTPRHGQTPSTMPVALLVALMLTEMQDLLARLLAWATDRAAPVAGLRAWVLRAPMGVSNAALLLALLAFAYMSSITSWFREEVLLTALDAEQRAAMAWVRERADEQASFVVLSEAKTWQRDGVAEWFPVLAGRVSVTTPQGLEWMRERDYAHEGSVVNGLKWAQRQNAEAMATVTARVYADRADHTAVFAEPGHPLYAGFEQLALYEVIYRTPAVSIYRRTPELARR